MVSLEMQIKTFIYMMILGHCLAIIFDFYRVIRGFGYINDIVTMVIDFIFALMGAGAVFFILLKSNFGQIRFYIFIGLALGIIIYHQLFSNLVIKVIRIILDVIIKIIMKVINLIIKVFRLIKYFFIKLKKLAAKLKFYS
ncbi:spore cortex biosynthesis protein YabQ [Sporohalobacter salinus]|uniref:spore cortex biosynthesis protein YabQ n=1 Tax=Sporohalobacter salinus TaxID=1494606 RepID=UPI001960286F|nr:spore cortex biosynthesis protein YabQ [Sporohalobacter salinus]MBM7623883.1 spore cortex biosynthesis protein YabQ [Sporohalobacter salinus]